MIGSTDGKSRWFGAKIIDIFSFPLSIFLLLLLVYIALFLSELLFPIISILSGGSAIVFLLVVLPLSLFKGLHKYLANISIFLSEIIGLSILMFSFLVIFNYLGWIAVFFAFLFWAIIPIATIGLFIKGQWFSGFSIILGLVLIYIMRLYAFWLFRQVDERIENENYYPDDFVELEEDAEDIEGETKQIYDLFELDEENNVDRNELDYKSDL